MSKYLALTGTEASLDRCKKPSASLRRKVLLPLCKLRHSVTIWRCELLGLTTCASAPSPIHHSFTSPRSATVIRATRGPLDHSPSFAKRTSSPGNWRSVLVVRSTFNAYLKGSKRFDSKTHHCDIPVKAARLGSFRSVPLCHVRQPNSLERYSLQKFESSRFHSPT